MALEDKMQAAVALHRFGLVPRAGGLAAFSRDPRGALIAELSDKNAGQIVNDDLMSSGEALRAAFDFRQERKAQRLARRAGEETERTAKAQARLQPDAKVEMAAPVEPAATPKQPPGLPQQIFLEEANARLDCALKADVGFVERLVWFWSNHFCVSADKGQVRPLVGAFEREAIRPHVTGKFADMLIAVEQHPAMLMYLDNARSIGPESFAGQRRGKGLNENLAREIMELHTLGVRTGYSQADVTNFAKVLTGWSVVPPKQERGGEFTFNPRMHEPGTQHVIDRDYPDRGVEQGRAVLARLAAHPATARHIAGKLARHFVADDPPPVLVAKLEKRFRDTDGDLKEVALALIAAPEAWDAPRQKLRRPGEWLAGSLRATGIFPSDTRPIVRAQALLGEPLWRPPAPNGFSDGNDAWMDGLAQRLDIANKFARTTGELIDPEAVADASFGPLLSNDTRETLSRAESRTQAVALLLMSPEFQRR
jgi:uncharacterized protein (DUF1800 family)